MDHLLLNKFFANDCNPHEREEIISWMLNPANDFVVKQWMRNNWDKLSDFDQNNELDIDQMWNKLQLSLQLEVDKPQTSATNTFTATLSVTPKRNFKKIILRSAAAAAVIILLSLTVTWLKTNNLSKYSLSENQFNKTISNTTNSIKVILLEDGTKVSLSQNASLSYSTNPNLPRREVTLEGNAFFDVAKNAEKPFLVFSKNIVTKVLGTSFYIQTGENSNDVTVSVVTGKVQVFEKNQENSELLNSKSLSTKGVLLTPNQKTIYTATKQNFETSIVEKPVLVDKQHIGKGYFDFDRAYLLDIVNKLQKVYRIEIILENDNFNKCIFSGDITDENLYEKLDLICKSIGASYEISGTRILITGKGCK